MTPMENSKLSLFEDRRLSHPSKVPFIIFGTFRTVDILLQNANSRSLSATDLASTGRNGANPIKFLRYDQSRLTLTFDQEVII